MAKSVITVAITRLKGPKFAEVLGIDAPGLNRLLTKGKQFSPSVRIRIIERWQDLQLRPDELTKLHEEWPEAAEAVRRSQKVILECPPAFFITAPLFAQKNNLFTTPETRNTPIEVRWHEKEDTKRRLTGQEIIDDVLKGKCFFGMAHHGLLEEHPDNQELIYLVHVAQGVEARICIPEETYVRVQEKIQRTPIFREIVEYICQSGGCIYLDRTTVARLFKDWLAEKMNLPQLNELPVKPLTYEHISAGFSPSEPCLVISWPPMTFLLTHPVVRDGRRFHELSESYYGRKEHGFRPHCDRNVPPKADIYLASSDFGAKAYTVFTLASNIHGKDIQGRNYVNLCLALYQGFDRALSRLKAVCNQTTQSRESLTEVAELLQPEIERMLGVEEQNPIARANLTDYIRTEMCFNQPILEMGNRALRVYTFLSSTNFSQDKTATLPHERRESDDQE